MERDVFGESERQSRKKKQKRRVKIRSFLFVVCVFFWLVNSEI